MGPGLFRTRYSVGNNPAPMYNNSHLNITEESLDGKSYRRNSQTSTYIREQLNHIQTLHDKTIEEDEENM